MIKLDPVPVAYYCYYANGLIAFQINNCVICDVKCSNKVYRCLSYTLKFHVVNPLGLFSVILYQLYRDIELLLWRQSNMLLYVAIETVIC